MARKYTKRPTANQLALGAKVDVTALYIRVSTEKQADEGFSLDAQGKRLRAFCEAQEWLVDDTHIYVDAGVSGKSTDREQFQAMLQAAQSGEVTRIVAVKLDRVARNVKSFLHIVDELKAVGCDLVLIQESFDTSTPHGKFALTMFAAMAELEASTIADRMRSGKTEKASEGGYNGTRIPLGYIYADEQFSIADDSADVVRSVFADFLAGQGLSAIAQRLNDAGATTAKGGNWYASTVRYILSNGFYAGLVQWGNSEDVAGTHPAIISRETYDHAQARLNALRPGPVAV